MRDDIPLQTPRGSYNPSWLRKNRWWLLLVAITGLAMYAGAVVVTCLGKPQPTTLAINIVVSESLPVAVSPKRLHHAVSIKGRASSQEFEIWNPSPAAVTPWFSLSARGVARFPKGSLQLLNLSAVEVVPAGQRQGPVELTPELATVAFVLQALQGLSEEGTISAGGSARFRLTATNNVDQMDEEHVLILFISMGR